MKKNLVKERDKKNDYEELNKKILDLCMWHQMESSYRWIGIIDHKIKFCDIKIQHLLDSKPFFFQKRKLKKFNKELEKIEQEKIKLKKEISEEFNIIAKLEKEIYRDEILDYENSDLVEEISYYDLLRMIKLNINPNKVSLSMCNKEKIYIFNERNYILDDDEENEIFKTFLGDSLSDKGKLENNIKILQ